MSKALLAAAQRGDLAKVQQQLAAGADVNSVHKPTGRTPLIEATIAGHLPVAQALVAAGADLHHSDTAVGFTALLWACEQDNLPLADYLLEAGADVHFQAADYGFTALLLAANQSLPLVQRLLQAGADVHAATTDGRTALAIAEEEGKDDIAAALAKAGGSAKNTVPVPAPIAWPAVNKSATNVDFDSPESVVRGLIIAMHAFELAARQAKTNTARIKLMNDVFARFCTPKERPYGRQGSYSMPPEYDPQAEYLIASTYPQPRRAEITTRNDKAAVPQEFVYVLLKKGGRWLVDNKKQRLVGGTWDSWHI